MAMINTTTMTMSTTTIGKKTIDKDANWNPFRWRNEKHNSRARTQAWPKHPQRPQHTHLVGEPESSVNVLHDDRRIAILDERDADHLQVLVLEKHLVVILLLAQVERRGWESSFVPGRRRSGWKRGWDEGKREKRKNKCWRYSTFIFFQPSISKPLNTTVLEMKNEIRKSRKKTKKARGQERQGKEGR